MIRTTEHAAGASVRLVRIWDVRTSCGERPVWIPARLAEFNDRFEENALQCRYGFSDLAYTTWRVSLHRHRAASSAKLPFW